MVRTSITLRNNADHVMSAAASVIGEINALSNAVQHARTALELQTTALLARIMKF